MKNQASHLLASLVLLGALCTSTTAFAQEPAVEPSPEGSVDIPALGASSAPTVLPTVMQAPVTVIMTAPQATPQLPAIDIGLGLDVLIPVPLQNTAPSAEKVRVRALEIWAQSEIVPTLKARVDVAGSDEQEMFTTRMHEAYVASENSLSHFGVKIGKFLLGVGVLNRSRPLSWSFVSAPSAQQKFFATETVSDTGAEFNWHSDPMAKWSITAGITNGYSFGDPSLSSGRKPLTPTHYARPAMKLVNDSGRTLSLGIDYLSRTDDAGSTFRLAGLDFVYTRELAGRLLWLFQSEAYHRYSRAASLPLAEELGGYFYAQRSLTDRWSAGVRLDGYSVLSLDSAAGQRRGNLDYAIVPTATFYANQNFRFRGAYNFINETREGSSVRIEQRVELQLTALLGSRVGWL